MKVPCQACRAADAVSTGTGLGDKPRGRAFPWAHVSSDFLAWEGAQDIGDAGPGGPAPVLLSAPTLRAPPDKWLSCPVFWRLRIQIPQ